MAGLMAKRPTTMKKRDKTKAQQAIGTKAFTSTIPSQEEIKGRKHEPKSPRILHVIKDKYKLERMAEPDNARVVEMV